MAKKYTNRPIIIEAIQFTGLDNGELSPKTVDFFAKASSEAANAGEGNTILVSASDGNKTANVGDYIIKNADGDFYPIEEKEFHQTYEPVE